LYNWLKDISVDTSLQAYWGNTNPLVALVLAGLVDRYNGHLVIMRPHANHFPSVVHLAVIDDSLGAGPRVFDRYPLARILGRTSLFHVATAPTTSIEAGELYRLSLDLAAPDPPSGYPRQLRPSTFSTLLIWPGVADRSLYDGWIATWKSFGICAVDPRENSGPPKEEPAA
jgi:hypothetical protein